MTTININDNLFNFKSNLGKKSEKPKPGRSAKLHRTDDYWLKMHNAERRKQTKVRHDTHRREQQPDAEDQRLEDIHFANFLGLPRSEWGNGKFLMTYNSGTYSDEYNIDNHVNICDCDRFIRQEQQDREQREQDQREQQEQREQEQREQEQREQEQQEQEQREQEQQEQRALSAGYVYAEEPTEYFNDDVSLIGSEDDGWGWGLETHIPAPFVTNWEAANTWPAPEWQDNLKFCEERNRQEVELFVEEDPDPRVRLTAESLRALANEEANFAAMVAYMRQQVQLAQQMMEDELTPCDCCR